MNLEDQHLPTNNNNMQEQLFCIAGLNVRIHFKDSNYNGFDLLPSFSPFAIEDPQGESMLEIVVDDSLKPIPKGERERIRAFDTGNGETIVDRVKGGGYQFLIKDINNRSCCLCQVNADYTQCHCALNGDYFMRTFGLNNAVMLSYSFYAAYHDAILIHASLVRNNGYGYAFIAKSGTGKSTQVGMWLRTIPGCDLMNDDNPVIRIIDGKPMIFGSPWSGKTPCYRNVSANLGAVTRIDRSSINYVERLSPTMAFSSLLPSCSSMKWDVKLYETICDVITKVIETSPLYVLHCLPNEDAAKVCYQTISR